MAPPLNWLTRQFELSRERGAANISPMEGLRGLAVFLVYLVHYGTLSQPWIVPHSSLMHINHVLKAMGNAGVDLFFVISGYLIYGILISQHRPFSSYITRRIQRIYPAFAVMLGIYVCLSFVFPMENKIPATLWAGTLCLLANFLLLPGVFPMKPIIRVAWSLSYEMFFYLVLPAVIAIFRLWYWRSSRRVFFFSLVAVATVLYFSFFGGHDCCGRMVIFISGILLWEALENTRSSFPNSLTGFMALAIGLLSTLVAIPSPYNAIVKTSIIFLSFPVLCMNCIRNPSGWLPQAFSWTPLRWLGNMSYSYYLIHGLALKMYFLVFARVWPPVNRDAFVFWLLLPVMFLLTIIPAAALFLAIERPFSLATTQQKGR